MPSRDEILDKMYELDCEIERDVRYYSKRKIFFDRLHRLFLLFVLVTSSASVLALFSEIVPEEKAKIFSAFISFANGIFAAIDTVIGFTIKARDNDAIYKKLMSLMATLRTKNENQIDEEFLHDIEKQFLLATLEHPPVYKALRAISHNEVITSHGRDNEEGIISRKISPWQWLMCNVITFNDTNFLPKAIEKSR